MLAGFWACVAEYALSYVRTQKLRYHAGQEPSLQPKSTTGEPGQTKQAKRKACDWMEMVAAYTGEQEGWRVNIKEGKQQPHLWKDQTQKNSGVDWLLEALLQVHCNGEESAALQD